MKKNIQEQVNSMMEYLEELNMIPTQIGPNIIQVDYIESAVSFDDEDWFLHCFLDAECVRKRTNKTKGYKRWWMDDVIIQIEI